MASIERVELWSDVEPAGGVRRAVLNHLIALTETVNLAGEHTVTVEIEYDHPAIVTLDTPAGQTNVQGGRVIRLHKSNGKWSEHRIAESTTIHRADSLTRRLVAQSIWLDLATKGIIALNLGKQMRTTSFSMLGLTAAGHWNQFIYPALVEGLQTWWRLELEVLASVEAQPLDLVYDNDTPLSALRKIADTLGGYELGLTADTEYYTVVLQRQIGESAPQVTARAKRNLQSLTHSVSQTNQATRIYPVGSAHEAGRVTLGEAEWALSGALPVRTTHPTNRSLN